MAAGRHFKNTNCHNLAALQGIFTKFGTEIDTGEPRLALLSNFTSDKIQDGGGRHFKNYSYNFATHLPIYVIFGSFSQTEPEN